MSEKDGRQGSLTAEEMIRLRRVRREFDGGTGSNIGLPMIDEKTINKLKNTLNIDGKISSQEDDPYFRAYKIAQRNIDSFNSGNESLKAILFNFGGWLNKKLPSDKNEHYEIDHDAVSIGTFLVFEAFELQFGKKFIENLGKVSPKEIMEATDICWSQIEDSSSLVERSRNRIKFPEIQVSLGDLIEKLVDFNSNLHGPKVELGAVLGFSLIEKLWPKIRTGLKTDN